MSALDDNSAPIFIGGAARSGTTLLRVLLDSHPRIACGPELKIIPDWLQQWQHDIKSFGDYAAENLRMDRGVLDDAYRAKLSRLFDWVRERSGKARIAEKTPHNVIYFGHLDQLFPASPLIHVIRDGRDVVASLLGMDWYYPDGQRVPYTQNVAAAVQYWADAVGAGLTARRHLGSKVLEVRYERLVRHLEREMRRVLAHLGEPWDEAVLHHHRYPHDLAGETSAGQVSRPVPTTSVGRWRSVLSDADLATIRDKAGRRLAELGYD